MNYKLRNGAGKRRGECIRTFRWVHRRWEEVSGQGTGCHHLVTPLWPTGHLGLPCPLVSRGYKSAKPWRWCLLLPVLLTSNTCHVWSIHPTSACNGLFTGPNPPPLGIQGLGDLENGRRPGPLPFRCRFYLLFHFCLILSTWFAPGSSKYFPLCYKELCAWDMDTWLYIVKLQ